MQISFDFFLFRKCKELVEQVHELEQLQHAALKDSHRIQVIIPAVIKGYRDQ